MDVYIMRWGVLWFFSLVLAILAAGDGVPAGLSVASLLAAIGSAGGLAYMIWTYRRASRAIEERPGAFVDCEPEEAHTKLCAWSETWPSAARGMSTESRFLIRDRHSGWWGNAFAFDEKHTRREALMRLRAAAPEGVTWLASAPPCCC